MKDYNKIAERAFYDAMTMFGLSQDIENGHDGLQLTVETGDDEVRLLAGLSQLQANLFRVTMALHTTLLSDNNDEFYQIKRYYDLMQGVLDKEMERLMAQYADDKAYSSITEIN